ncbi:F-box/kelch-repeat protein at3g61590 [Phtheirospermum japonicum]|uniref:F-box/kelch-repeat protein at3g61590 n=1 Tax=Phtheirospermum japonicum TaxID=374723 RepID=A0A830CGW8_9LAMI|nr:F-box/kelch-repeat protein at3g61590 [Phtheirospermum japonicum]
MDKDSRGSLCVCNPITKYRRWLYRPPGPKCPDYSSLAISVDRGSRDYKVSIVKCKEIPGSFFQWDLSIHVYDSRDTTWATNLNEILAGWRAGDESVICDGVLYFLIYATGGGDSRHGLLAYDLKARSAHGLLMRSFVPVPCSLTCGRLMNLKERLVMVGGIGKHDRAGIIKGIGIWALDGKEWREMARMPPKYFQGFGELDDVFASGGTDDLIYIHSYGSPALLIFDVELKKWKWSSKCPVTKKFPLQLFTGFCFEPRPEIAP